MKILVLNGSPKGGTSVTMQYINFLANQFTNIEFETIDIVQNIKTIENDYDEFNKILSKVESCDGVIWAFPLYVLTAASGYHRFIELIFERRATDYFFEKYAAVITTSIHFYDHTAINYIHSICDDMNMNYYDFFSLKMYDLKDNNIRENFKIFATHFFDTIEKRISTPCHYPKIKHSSIKYTHPGLLYETMNNNNKNILIIADSLDNDNLKNMINQYSSNFSAPISLLILDQLDIKGSCVGCLKCAYNYRCIYHDKDDLTNIFRNSIKNADVVIFAGSIGYRYLSSTWKTFFDRSFYNNHSPSLINKQVGYILSGPLSQIDNLRQILWSYTEVNCGNLIGFVTDEYDTSKSIDAQIYAFAKKTIDYTSTSFHRPDTFLGVAGRKIFRDEIWGRLRFPFIADYKAYKELDYFDFPHKDYKARLVNSFLIFITKIPSIRKIIYGDKSKGAMIVPLKKLVDNS